jgi:hypothetical protein
MSSGRSRRSGSTAPPASVTTSSSLAANTSPPSATVGASVHQIRMTVVETIDPSLTTSTAKLSGTPFGDGTGVFKAATLAKTTLTLAQRAATMAQPNPSCFEEMLCTQSS